MDETVLEFDPVGGDAIGVGVLSPTTPPTMKETYEDSSADTFSVTEDPVHYPAKATATTPQPTKPNPKPPTAAPTMANLAGVKGELAFRRKSVGFQSNWGPAHTGSMIYDFTRNTIYVTGTQIQPDTANDFQRSTCFVGQLPIADAELWKMADPPLPPNAKGKVPGFKIPEDLVDRETLGCHVVYYDANSKTNDNLYVGGVCEKDATDRHAGIRAFLNNFQRTRKSPSWKLRLDPIALRNPNPVNNMDPPSPIVDYPVAMASGIDHFSRKDAILVISVGSDDAEMTVEYIENQDARNHNNRRNALQPPGAIAGDPSRYAVPKRGDYYFMTLYKYVVENGGEKLVYQQSQQIRTPHIGNVYPTGVINILPDGEAYIVAGSLQGRDSPPELFPENHGGKAGDAAAAHQHTQDFDGFTSLYSYPYNKEDKLDFDRDHSIRISSTENDPPLDDFVHGVCPGIEMDDGRILEYYVVGSTYGTLPKGNMQSAPTTNILREGNSSDANSIHGNAIHRLAAYATKIEIDTENGHVGPVWTTQLYAKNMPSGRLQDTFTEALGCHLIDSHPDTMYIAGTVYNGGLMEYSSMTTAQQSAGGDDVWVAKLATEDGSIEWIRQIGSSGSDKLARTNGLEVDVHGHAIVYGETTGEMFRRKSWDSPDEHDYNDDSGSSSDVFVTTFDRVSGASESTIENDDQSSSGYILEKGTIGVVVAIIVLIVIMVPLFCRCRRRRRKSKYKRSRRRPKRTNIQYERELTNIYNNDDNDNNTVVFQDEPPNTVIRDESETLFQNETDSSDDKEDSRLFQDDTFFSELSNLHTIVFGEEESNTVSQDDIHNTRFGDEPYSDIDIDNDNEKSTVSDYDSDDNSAKWV